MLAARVEPKNGRQKSKKTGNFKPLDLGQFQLLLTQLDVLPQPPFLVHRPPGQRQGKTEVTLRTACSGGALVPPMGILQVAHRFRTVSQDIGEQRPALHGTGCRRLTGPFRGGIEIGIGWRFASERSRAPSIWPRDDTRQQCGRSLGHRPGGPGLVVERQFVRRSPIAPHVRCSLRRGRAGAPLIRPREDIR
jgi:hypothetical protein